VIVGVDKCTYDTYVDWFDEFNNIRIAFLRKKKGLFSLFFHSTASDFRYDETQLVDLIKNEKIDVIITAELFSFLSKQVSSICRKFSLSHVVIVWENIASHPFYHVMPFKGNVDFVKRNASKIIAVTNKSKNSLITLGLPAEKINVVYPGVSLDRFRPMKTQKEFSILFVGGLEKHKGFHLLLKAFENLCGRYDGLTLGVVGDGKLRGKLFVMRRKCGDQRIVYLGKIPHSKIHLIYPKAEIFCFPSLRQKILRTFLIREEQFGFSLVEAMASGLPVVATSSGVIQEIIGSANLCCQNYVKELIRTTTTLIEDDGLREEMSSQNRRRAEVYFDAKKQSQLFLKSI
jgi:glycosyltransferase involved in cell wall biosynthesis